MKGRPKRFEFSGLFLPSIEWELKLEELPWRELEEDPHMGTLMRNQRRKDSMVTHAKLEAALMKVCGGKGFGNPFVQQLLKAVAGDEAAQQQAMQLGPWGCFSSGCGEAASSFVNSYAELEPLCARADRLLAAGKFTDTASEVERTAEISIFWRRNALERLRLAQTNEQALIARVQAWLELQMSILARISLTSELAILSQAKCGGFEEMLTTIPANPGKTLMRKIQQFVGAASLAKLKDKAAMLCAEDQFPSDPTFSRWCSGAIFPSQERISPFLRASAQIAPGDLPIDQREQVLNAQFYVARRFRNVLAMADLWRDAGTCVVEQVLGFSNSSQWALDSFQYWLGHWRGSHTSDLAS